MVTAEPLRAQEAGTTTSHGLSTFGDLKYPADFAHFDYVNPDAPKGGIYHTWTLGNLDLWTLGLLDPCVLGPLGLWNLGHLDTWTFGRLGTWTLGPLGLWTLGPLDPRIRGPVDPWAQGPLGAHSRFDTRHYN